ncbi:MAG: hypothetical protein QM786_02320 [Breznakibacter sp.]
MFEKEFHTLYFCFGQFIICPAVSAFMESLGGAWGSKDEAKALKRRGELLIVHKIIGALMLKSNIFGP